MENIILNYSGAKVRREMLHGRPHLVAQMTTIVPGVLNGSKGRLFYSQEETAKDPATWNHTPIVVYHPNVNGRNVSARSPEILNSSAIGVLLRSQYRGKLTHEGWFDIENTKRVDLRVYDALVNGRPMELSTGLFTDNEPAAPGANYKGQPYDYIARNYRPDHLAILPDQVGACSIKDGCGLHVNKKNESVSNGGPGSGPQGGNGSHSLESKLSREESRAIGDWQLSDRISSSTRKAVEQLLKKTTIDGPLSHLRPAEGTVVYRGQSEKTLQTGARSFSTKEKDAKGWGSTKHKLVITKDILAIDLSKLRPSENEVIVFVKSAKPTTNNKKHEIPSTITITNADGTWKTLPNGVRILVKDGNIVGGPKALRKDSKTGAKPPPLPTKKSNPPPLPLKALRKALPVAKQLPPDLPTAVRPGFLGKLKSFFGVNQMNDDCVCGGTCKKCATMNGGPGNGPQPGGGSGDIKIGSRVTIQLPHATNKTMKSTGVVKRVLSDRKLEIKTQLHGYHIVHPTDILTTNALPNQPKSQVSGKFKRVNAGIGKGPVHEAAQYGHVMLSTLDNLRGKTATEEVAKGVTIPSWASDEGKFNKAKLAADTGNCPSDKYWATVAYIYERLGGVTNMINNGGPGSGPNPGGESSASSKDTKHAQGSRPKKITPISPKVHASLSHYGWKSHDGETYTHPDLPEQSMKIKHEMLPGGRKRAVAEHSDGKQTLKIPSAESIEYHAMSIAKREGHLKSGSYVGKQTTTNGGPGSGPRKGSGPHKSISANQQGITMDRNEVIEYITANCSCWNSEDDVEVLNYFSDDKLTAIAEDVRLNSEREATLNAIQENLGEAVFNAACTTTMEENALPFPPKKKAPVVPAPAAVAEEEEIPEEEALESDEEEIAEEEVPAPMTKNQLLELIGNLSVEEWQRIAPREVVEATNNAMKIEKEEKARLAMKLVANLKGEAQKTKFNGLMKKSLGDLVEISDLMTSNAAPQSQGLPSHTVRRAPMFAGAAGAPTSNSKKSTNNAEDDNDFLPLPTMNYTEEAKLNGKHRS